MLESLHEGDLASGRKVRLSGCACRRRAWHLLDADGRALVQTAERFADGSATEDELLAAVWASRGTGRRRTGRGRTLPTCPHRRAAGWRGGPALSTRPCDTPGGHAPTATPG